MTATNGKANGHDRPPFAEPIREQGPKDYPTMRARLEARAAAEAGTPPLVLAPPPGSTKPPLCAAGHVAKPGEPCPVCYPLSPVALRALTGRPADATLPAGTAPPVDLSLVLLGAIADTTGSSLRVERDPRDERHYVTTAFDGTERPVEVPAAVARGVAKVLVMGGWEDAPTFVDGKAVQPTSAPVKQTMPIADVENDGDRGPRYDMARARFMNAAADLPGEWIPVATWILQRLPTLRETVRDLTMATAEPVDRFATMHEKSTLVATPREHIALASLWRAVLDVSRLIDPHRDVRRGGAR